VLLELRDKQHNLVSATFKVLRALDVLLVVATATQASFFVVVVVVFFTSCSISSIGCCCFGFSLLTKPEASSEGRSEILFGEDTSVGMGVVGVVGVVDGLSVVGASTAVPRLMPASSTSRGSAKHSTGSNHSLTMVNLPNL